MHQTWAKYRKQSSELDEVVIKFWGSKLDQFKAGCVHNLFSSEVEGLCPVAALWQPSCPETRA